MAGSYHGCFGTFLRPPPSPHDSSCPAHRPHPYRRGRVALSTASPPMIRRSPPLWSTFRRAARSAIWPCRWRSSWLDGCARRRKIIAQEIVGQLGRLDGFARIEAANGYINFFLDRVAPSRRLADRRSKRRPRRLARRRSSSTRPSTRTRRRTSAICATRRSATRSAGCSAILAAPSRSRTTSTTPASRSPTSPSASASSKRRTSPASAQSPTARASITTAGTSTPA